MSNVAYETVMVINAKLTEEEISNIIQKFTNLIIESNGVIEETQEWGKRKLAYEIDDHKEGYYVFISFNSDAKFPSELSRVYKITDEIIRSLIVKKKLN